MTSIQPTFQANEWPIAFATSGVLSCSSYVMFRGVWALIFVVHLAVHMYLYIYLRGEGLYYFMFQSRQAFILQTVTMVQQFVAALAGLPKLPRSSDTVEPLWVRAVVLIDSYVQPQAFGITYIYWGWMGFAPAEMMDEVELKPVVDYLDAFIHGINWALLLVSFLLSRIPFNCSSLGAGLLLGSVYVLWTYVHYRLEIGTPFDCDEYPFQRERCPLYDAFDWNEPWRALLFVLLAYGLTAPINTLSYVALAYGRSRCCPEKATEEKVQLLEEERPAEPEFQKPCCCGCG
ncbi:unnamed protein product [Durusdinium trenchii]|uniref:Uncharacterized protein n=1 Tax=Durusdinium trenchii TaxID=1381693 RepID=A0ABP0MAS5_9DINO